MKSLAHYPLASNFVFKKSNVIVTSNSLKVIFSPFFFLGNTGILITAILKLLSGVLDVRPFIG